MNDDFLHSLRREPAPEFTERLRASLGRKDPAAASSRRLRDARWPALAASIALLGIAFTLPSVRAGAQAFLDLFRVVDFAGVSFDESRFAELEELDLTGLLGEPEVEAPSVAVLSFGSVEDAGAAAGMQVLTPAWMPVAWERSSIEVLGERTARTVAQTAGLQRILDELGLTDVAIPPGLDGATVTVHVPSIVDIGYRNGDAQAHLLQARSPEVSFPAGTDLAALAEVALRVLGMGREEAYNFARSVDWRSTLLVPVPAAAGRFSRVDVAGSSGLLVDSQGQGRNMLMWTSDERVFALGGRLSPVQLLEIAQTVQ